MSIATTTAIAVGTLGAAGIGAASSLAAGSMQSGAAKSAQQLQAEAAKNTLDFQKQEWQTQQNNEAPFLKAGQTAEGELSNLTSTPGQGLLTPWTDTFKAPTAEEAAATPGYQFQLKEGEQQLQNSAAATGGLLTGGTAKAIDQYSQGLASSNYQTTFSNALQQYQTAYNTFQNNQTNTFNRLATQAGMGQTTAATLGQEGSAAAGNVAYTNVNAGAQQGANINNAAYTSASGYVGAANALAGGVNSYLGNKQLQQLLARQANPDWALGGS
jgi:hypothetical protein